MSLRFASAARVAAIVLLWTTVRICLAQTALPQPTSLLHTSGTVHVSLVLPNGKILIAGSFSAIDGVARNNIALLNTDGSLDASWNADVDDVVFALAPSANGTIYIGGAFASIDGQARAHLGEIDLTTGAPTSWNPGANDVVTVLTVAGSKIYIGGTFTKLCGISRSNIGAVDVGSGKCNVWNPVTNGQVTSMAMLGSDVLVGGWFTGIGGQQRAGLALLDNTTGSAKSWNAALSASGNPSVRTFAIQGNTIYVAGYFSAVGSAQRASLAALDATTAIATSWNPAVDSFVEAIAVSAGAVYVGGAFAHVAGQPRKAIAVIDAASGQTTSWNPVASGVHSSNYFSTIAISGTRVFLGGQFQALNGKQTGGFTSFDSSSGLQAEFPHIQQPGYVGAFARQADGKVVVGGFFQSVNGIARNNLARLNADGSVDATFDPSPDGSVEAMAESNGTLFVGGWFTSIAGGSRGYLVAFDEASGALKTWDPQANLGVQALTTAGNTLYAGGFFGMLGGAPRTGIGAVDMTSGLATAFAPILNGSSAGYFYDPGVLAVAVRGNTAYVGGSFTSANNQYRGALAALDANSGALQAWNPGIYTSSDSNCKRSPGEVRGFALTNHSIFVAGSFGYIGGEQRSCLAELDLTTGVPTAWDAHMSGSELNSIAVSGNTLYAAGYFSAIGGQYRAGVAALDTNTALATNWDAEAQLPLIEIVGDRGVDTVALIGNTVYAGGGFSAIAGQQRFGIAALTASEEIFHDTFE